MRCLATEFHCSVDTVRRWVRRVLCRAPLLVELIERMYGISGESLGAACSNTTTGPVDARRKEVARILEWVARLGELTLGQTLTAQIGSWAAANTQEPFGGMWL
jgi:hypothetical protein